MHCNLFTRLAQVANALDAVGFMKEFTIMDSAEEAVENGLVSDCEQAIQIEGKEKKADL